MHFFHRRSKSVKAPTSTSTASRSRPRFASIPSPPPMLDGALDRSETRPSARERDRTQVQGQGHRKTSQSRSPSQSRTRSRSASSAYRAHDKDGLAWGAEQERKLRAKKKSLKEERPFSLQLPLMVPDIQVVAATARPSPVVEEQREVVEAQQRRAVAMVAGTWDDLGGEEGISRPGYNRDAGVSVVGV